MTGLARLAAIACTFASAMAAAQAPAVVPNPASAVRYAGIFRLSASTPVVVDRGDGEAMRVASILADLVKRSNGIALPVREGAPRDLAVNLRIDAASGLAPEGYRVEVKPRRITLTASTPRGLFYAAATLWQLVPLERRVPASVQAGVIEDAPRFAWRGMMLDSARHFQSPDFIRRFIDAMAMHKLNVLHWHLTDDQAWRLEIRKYPKLTSVGAWRMTAGASPRRYGGFYSQKDVREIVAYAAARGITIIPEIDVPGHVTAMIAAYPELAAPHDALPREVPADWGVYPYVLNTKESTFAFVEDVYAEVVELFPGPFVHKGGDEVSRDEFTPRIAKFLEAHGRRLVGWDEILGPGLAPSAVVMSWRGLEGALTAAASGHDAVLAPDPALYFDNRQGVGNDEPPGRIRVLASLESVYRFEPMPPGLAPAERKHLLGLQGNLWSEHIRTEERMGTMAFPRAAAIAELGWSTPARRDWSDFLRRLTTNLPRYDVLGMPWSDSAFAVAMHAAYSNGSARVDMSTQTGRGEIRFTTDGTEPRALSRRYEAPIDVRTPATVRAASFDGSRPLARPRSLLLRPDAAQRRTSHELKLCGNAIALALEDDAPATGARAVFAVDVQDPCWIFPGAQLDRVRSVVASVGQLPFNFQIGDAVKKIRFAQPATPEGELEVHVDSCDGEVIARLPLAPAAANPTVTTLPPAAIKFGVSPPVSGTSGPNAPHDLCLRFAQPALEPMWVIDTITLLEAAP
jgi:hexosaminidase